MESRGGAKTLSFDRYLCASAARTKRARVLGLGSGHAGWRLDSDGLKAIWGEHCPAGL